MSRFEHQWRTIKFLGSRVFPGAEVVRYIHYTPRAFFGTRTWETSEPVQEPAVQQVCDCPEGPHLRVVRATLDD